MPVRRRRLLRRPCESSHRGSIQHCCLLHTVMAVDAAPVSQKEISCVSKEFESQKRTAAGKMTDILAGVDVICICLVTRTNPPTRFDWLTDPLALAHFATYIEKTMPARREGSHRSTLPLGCYTTQSDRLTRCRMRCITFAIKVTPYCLRVCCTQWSCFVSITNGVGGIEVTSRRPVVSVVANDQIRRA